MASRYFSPGSDGTMEQTQGWTPVATAIEFGIPIKNYGPVPGTNFKGNWRVFFGGNEINMLEIPSLPGTIYPTQEVYLEGRGPGRDYVDLMNGKELILRTQVEYDTPSKHEESCQKYQYVRQHHSFVTLDACK